MAESGNFDFTSLIARETETMTINDPVTGKPLPGVVFHVYGKDSEQFQKVENRINRERFRKARGSRSLNIDPAEMRQNDIEMLAACIAGWEGVNWKNAPLPYTPQNAVMLLTEVPAIREQVDVFVGDRTNFL